MKISKSALLLISVGIPVVLLGGLGMTRSRQFDEQSKLRQQLSSARQRLYNLQTERGASAEKGQEKKLNDTTANLNAVKATLTPDITSISASERLLAIANACGVSITQVDSAGLVKDEFYGIKGSGITINLIAEGTVPNLTYFVQKLNTEHSSGTVETYTISVPSDEAKAQPQVKVKFTIYTCEES